MGLVLEAFLYESKEKLVIRNLERSSSNSHSRPKHSP